MRQLDHAAFSGDLARRWGGGELPDLAPAESVILAASRHDAGWPELDETPTLDPGTSIPHDYRTVPLEDRLAVAERSVARVAAVDPYAGWLVSRHFASFHEGADDPDAIRWVTAQVGRRAEMLARARASVDREDLHPLVLEANLDFVQLLDALSLAAIHGWESWRSDPMAGGYGEERTRFAWERVEIAPREVRARVSPYPFAPERVEGEVPARLLEGTRWSDQEELEEAWETGREVAVEVVLEAG